MIRSNTKTRLCGLMSVLSMKHGATSCSPSVLLFSRLSDVTSIYLA